MRAQWNFHQIWITLQIWFVKLPPGQCVYLQYVSFVVLLPYLRGWLLKLSGFVQPISGYTSPGIQNSCLYSVAHISGGHIWNCNVKLQTWDIFCFSNYFFISIWTLSKKINQLESQWFPYVYDQNMCWHYISTRLQGISRFGRVSSLNMYKTDEINSS